MLSHADPTFDLLVLELFLEAAFVRLVLLLIRLPVDAGSEHYVLAHGGRVEGRPWCMALLEAELGPRFPLGHSRVDMLLDDRSSNLARSLYLFAVVVETIGDDRLRAVLIAYDLLGRQDRLIIKVLIVCPVGPAAMASVKTDPLHGMVRTRTWLDATLWYPDPYTLVEMPQFQWKVGTEKMCCCGENNFDVQQWGECMWMRAEI